MDINPEILYRNSHLNVTYIEFDGWAFSLLKDLF